MGAAIVAAGLLRAMFVCAVLGAPGTAHVSHASPWPDTVGRAVPLADTAHPAAGAPGVASLFIRATEHGAPLAFSRVVIEGFKLGAMLNDLGEGSIDRIPAGRRVVRWVFIGYATRTDTLTFTAGQRESLLIRDPPEQYTNAEPGFEPRSTTVPWDHPLRRRLGVVWTRGDTTLLVCEMDSLASGSAVTALLMDSTGKSPSLRVIERLGQKNDSRAGMIFIDRAPALWVYRLARPDRRQAPAGIGLGAVGPQGRLRRIGRWLAVDLDGDGTAELVGRCADEDGHRLLVRTEREHRVLWLARFALDHAIEPTCTDEDSESE